MKRSLKTSAAALALFMLLGGLTLSASCNGRATRA